MTRIGILALVFSLAACGGGGGDGGSAPVATPPPACGPWPDQTLSPYVLPYEVGGAYRVGQQNCTQAGRSHQAGGTDQYAYDLLMPIGTVLVAARAGEVVAVRQSNADSTRIPGQENYVFIEHDDGTRALYFHLTQNGSMVTVGQMVTQGQPIALSGDSGASTEPHLHFIVVGPGGVPVGGLPVTFLNTRAHVNGLREGQTYTAESYPGLRV